MKIYLIVFVNYKQNNQIKPLLIAKFAYNNTKNTNTGYISFKFNYNYYLYISYKIDINFYSKQKPENELAVEFEYLIAVCRDNLCYVQEVQKQVYNKRTKSESHTFDKKVRLNSKYIKTKHNQNLEAKFFGFIQVLHLQSNQTY